MPVELESGAIRHLEDQIIEAAEAELEGQYLEVSMTQHAPGNLGAGVESVTIEVTADVDDTDLQDDLMDYAYDEFVGSAGNLVFQAVQKSHERLQSYGSSHDYSVGNIPSSFTGVETQRGGGTLTIGYGWSHPATSFFERGVSPHTINGQPILSFIWEDPPDWVKEEFDQGRSSSGQFASGWRVFFSSVDHPGIPAARFVRYGLNWLESEVSL